MSVRAAFVILVACLVLGGCSARSQSHAGRSRLLGDPRCMVRIGTEGSDRQVGTSCDDRLFGESGDDTQQGAGGHDVLFGGLGADIQLGDEGHDILFGGGGEDWQSGGPGDDTLVPGSGGGHVDGGTGHDTLVVDAGHWTWDPVGGGWRNAGTGDAIRMEAIERVIDTDGRQIWP